MLCVKMAGSSSASTSAAPPSTYSTGMDDQCSGSSESDGDQDSEQREVVSLLDRLKRPAPAVIARSRKIRSNQPPRGKRRCRGTL